MAKLFILHGWTHYAQDTWKPLLQELRSRGIEFEFLLVPGLTDGADPIWTLDDYVGWLNKKTAACDKVILYGHSNGGRISLAFAAKYPQKVERLVLEDSAGIPPRGLRRLKRDTMKKLSQGGKLFVRSKAVRDVFYRIIRENDYRLASPAMKKTLSNLVGVDLRPLLPSIDVPTLLIWGAQDKTTPLKDGELMRTLLPHARLVVLATARHSPHITHTAEVADLVEKEFRS